MKVYGGTRKSTIICPQISMVCSPKRRIINAVIRELLFESLNQAEQSATTEAKAVEFMKANRSERQWTFKAVAYERLRDIEQL